MENKDALDQLWAWGGCNPATFSEWDDREFSQPSRLLPESNQVKRWTALLTAFIFAWSMCVTPVMAKETLQFDGGTVEVDTKDNVTNWNVTGNPVWNIPEFNVAQGSVYNIAGLGSGASLALLVNGGQATNIFGTMNLFNLDFILQNIAGINIGANAAINLNSAALIASTLPLNLTATNFLAHDYQFGDPAAAQNGFLSNAGRITGVTGGAKDIVALISNAIENKGTIEVPMGTVALAAGKTVTVGISGDGMVSIGVDEATANELGLKDQIKNTGTISANGGKVMLTAKAVDGLFDKAINIAAESQAVGVVKSADGVIEFVAKGNIANAGTVEAQRGKIGIQSNGGDVTNVGTMNVDAGKINIDAGTTGIVFNNGVLRYATLTEKGYSFRSGSESRHEAGAEGAAAHYENIDGAAYLAGLIGTDQSDIGNLIIDTDQTVTLGADVIFTADSNGNGNGIFTMNSGSSLVGGGHNLTIYSGQNRSTHSDVDPSDDSAGAEQSIFKTVSGIGTLTLNSSNSSDTTYNANLATVGSFSIGTMKTNLHAIFTRSEGSGTAADPYMIYSISDAVGGMQNIQTRGLSASYRLANNIDASETSNWNSNGSGGYYGFTPVGGFSGKFFGDSHTISDLYINSSSDNSGLFGSTSGATIQDVKLVNVDVSGGNYVGGLVGYLTGSSSVSNSYVSGSVRGGSLIGVLVGTSIGSTVSNSHSSGFVSGGSHVGGLVGANSGASVIGSYSDVSVTGGQHVGGLVGMNAYSSISNSYATGSVNALEGVPVAHLGGFVGVNAFGSISNSYSTGSVDGSGAGDVGGFVGENGSSSITNCYSTGVAISAGNTPGGFAGYSNGGLTNNWWYNGTNTSGVASGTTAGLSKADAATDFNGTGSGTGGAVYSGWDFNGLWVSDAGTPHQIWQDMTGGGSVFNPWMVTNLNQLRFVAYGLSSYFQLANYIDAAAVALSVASGATLDIGSYDFAAASLANSGTVKLTGVAGQTVMGITSGTVEYSGATATGLRAGNSYTNLVFSGSGDYTLDSAVTVSGNFTLDSGTVRQNAILSVGGTYSQSSGAYDQNASLSITGNFSQTGGVFNQDDVFSAGGNFSPTGGTFNQGGDLLTIGNFTLSTGVFDQIDQIIITGTYSQTGGTFNNNNTLTIGNLSLSDGAFNQSANITVTGNYSQTGGTFTCLTPQTYSFSVAGNFSIPTTQGSFMRYTGNGLSVDTPYMIYDVYGLQAIQQDLDAFYKLNNDITATATSGWNSGAGFVSLGNDSTKFAGQFDGNSKTITGLTINASGTGYAGLFGYADVGSSISNLTLSNISVTVTGNNGASDGGYTYEGDPSNGYGTGNNGGDGQVIYAGALAGYSEATVSNVHVIGTSSITGTAGSGGLGTGAPYIEGTNVLYNAFTGGGGGSGASAYVGGLIGKNTGAVTGSDVAATVTGNSGSGGSGGDTGEYAIGGTGGNAGTAYVGGLIGQNTSTILRSDHLSGVVTVNAGSGGGGGNCFSVNHAAGGTAGAGGAAYGGGLIGDNTGSVTDSDASGAVNINSGNGGSGGNGATFWGGGNGNNGGALYGGGLIGKNTGVIDSSSHLAGTITGISGSGGNGGDNGQGGSGGSAGTIWLGGLIGYNSTGTVTDSNSTGSVNATSGVGGVGGFGTGVSAGGNGGSGGDVYIGGLIGQNLAVTILRSNHLVGDVTAVAGSGNASGDGIVSGGAGGNGGFVWIGGLIGNNAGSVTDSDASVAVTGTAGNGGNGAAGVTGGNGGSGGYVYAGGLLGLNTGFISGSGHLSGIVTGTSGNGGRGGFGNGASWGGSGGIGGLVWIGGLIGQSQGSVSNSNSADAVIGTGGAGGIAGNGTGGFYSPQDGGGNGGAVYIGGLIGTAVGILTITNSSSSSDVTGASGSGGNGFTDPDAIGGAGGNGGEIYAGGLVGNTTNNVTISGSHATGAVAITSTGNGGDAGAINPGYAYYGSSGGNGGNAYAGGLLGNIAGNISDSDGTGSVTVTSVGSGGNGSNAVSEGNPGGQGGNGGSITISDATLGVSVHTLTAGAKGTGPVGDGVVGTIRFTGTVNVNGDLTITGNYSQTDGTVNQNADISIVGDFSQTGGTFLDASPLDHTFTVSGSFSVPYATAGTFTRYTGTGAASTPYVIRDLYDLQAMKSHLTSNFTLNSNLDATAVASWNSNKGFDPIGDLTHAFTGTLQGAGKIITNLKLDRTNTDYIGFFGHIGVGGLVNMMGLENVSSYGNNYVGGLAAWNEGTLTNVYTTGSFTVMGVNFVGGLVGSNTGSIANAYSSTRVMGTDKVGGLAGSNTGTIDKTYTMGQVIGTTNTGGLVGSGSGTVTNSFWNANMTGQATSAGGTAGKVIRVTGQIDENGYAIPNPEDVANPDPDMMNSSSYSGWDFGSTWVLDPGGSFPHFQYRFPNGVRGVWGTVYNTEGATQEAGKIVDLYVNTDPLDTTGLGTKVDSTKSTADGMYYFVMGKNDVQATDWVIGKLDGGDGFTGNTRMPAATGSIEGLDIWGTMARNIPHANKYVEPAPVEIPSTNQLQQALEEVNKSLQTILNSISASESTPSMSWNSTADVQIQDETFSVPGLEWLRTEETKTPEVTMDLPEDAAISFYEQLTPGREPVPQLNPKAVTFSIAEKIMQQSPQSGTASVSGGTSSQVSGSQENGQSAGPGNTATINGMQAVGGAVSASESALSSDEEAGEEELSMDEDALLNGDFTSGASDASGNIDSNVSSQAGDSEASGAKDASRADRSRMDFSEFFSNGIAKRFLTDVRVIEGAVYVIDGVHTTSLLIPGESVRVFFKNHKDEERAKVPSYIHPPAEPEPMVLKTDPPVPGIKKDAELGLLVQKNGKPQATVGANPLMPVLKNDESVPSMKDDAAASSVKLDPKSFVLDPAPGASMPPAPKDIVNTTMSLAAELVNKGPMYGTLKNPGINVFVKCKGGEWQAATDGMVVLPGDEIRTAANNTVQVLLDNGKVGQVEVKEGSLFRISKAEMDPKTGDKTTLLDLAVGKVLVHAEKLQGGSKFEVKTPTALTGVRGTVFEVTVKEKL